MHHPMWRMINVYVILAGNPEDNHKGILESGSKIDTFLIFKLVGGFTV
jgi:hypothetical protein